MIRLFFTFFLLISYLYAQDTTICKSCHPAIYNEFQSSFHKKSISKFDKVHKAVWDRHPAKKKGNYQCAKCHSPQKEQGVTCLTCHTIVDIKEHKKSNENIYETKKKYLYSAQKGMEDKKVIYKEKSSWFGLVKEVEGSPYHDIDYTNKNYYTGKVCMGCHSHKQNGVGFELCKTDMKGVNHKQNCITCHMPKVKGSATTIRSSKTHAYHGFAGVRNAHKMLEKYIEIDIKKEQDGFVVKIKNKAPHELLTHPLRVLELRVLINGELYKSKTFQKVLGKDSKPTPPWLATEFIRDDMIKPLESRVLRFNKDLKNGDSVEVLLGYYIVAPDSLKKLGLEGSDDLKRFHILKREFINVK